MEIAKARYLKVELQWKKIIADQSSDDKEIWRCDTNGCS
jgi:hypothetical protein